MTDRELMQQALDAMLNFSNDVSDEMFESIRVLRARLAQPDLITPGGGLPNDHNGVTAAQPEQEPVAWHEPESYSNVTIHKKWAKENGWLPLYTAPPQPDLAKVGEVGVWGHGENNAV